MFMEITKRSRVAVVNVKMHVGGEEEVVVTCNKSKANF